MQKYLIDNYWLIKAHHLEEEEARLVQEIDKDQEELSTNPRLVFMYGYHSIKHLEVRLVEMMGVMDQEEEMDRMAMAHQMMNPRMASDLVVLPFRLMMETILEMDFGVSLASLRTSTSGESHCLLSWIYHLAYMFRKQVRSSISGRCGPRMLHLHSRLGMP